MNVINKDVKIEARIKYEGHDWTSWVSSDTPVVSKTKIKIIFFNIFYFQMKEHQKNYPSVVLLSIIIVSVVVVIILSFAIIFIIRNRNLAVKYDQEKQEGFDEENKMLNDERNDKD